MKAFTLFKTDLKSEETVDLWKNSIEIQDLKAIFLLADYNILDSRDFTSLQAVFSNKEKPVIVGCLGQPKGNIIKWYINIHDLSSIILQFLY